MNTELCSFLIAPPQTGARGVPRRPPPPPSGPPPPLEKVIGQPGSRPIPINGMSDAINFGKADDAADFQSEFHVSCSPTC